MKKIIALSIILAGLVISVAAGADNWVYDYSDGPLGYLYLDTKYLYAKYPEPTSSLTFTAPDGREAVIDFSGDKVTYRGMLSVSEGAELFFNAVFNDLAKYRTCDGCHKDLYLECSKNGGQ